MYKQLAAFQDIDHQKFGNCSVILTFYFISPEGGIFRLDASKQGKTARKRRNLSIPVFPMLAQSV